MTRLGRSAISLVVVGLLTGACTSSTQDGSSADPSSSPVQVTYTPSPASSSFGDLVSQVHNGQLEPGTYDYLDMDGYGPNVRFTVPAGWTWHGRYLSKGGVGLPDGAAIFFFAGPVQVYTDPCHWAGARSDPPTGFAVIDLMAALAAQPMKGAGTAIDRRQDGPFLAINAISRRPGMAIELTVPNDINFADCDGGQFRSWGPDNNARSNQDPGQRDLVWAVDGTGKSVKYVSRFGQARFIIDAASFPGTPADVMSEIGAILRSVAVGDWG